MDEPVPIIEVPVAELEEYFDDLGRVFESIIADLPGVPVPAIRIRAVKVVEAWQNLLRKCGVPHVPRLIDELSGALIVSFNKRWEPFAGESHGYNPPDQRFLLPAHSLLKRIVHHLRHQQVDLELKPGGRAFIEESTPMKLFGVYRKHGHRKEYTLVFRVI